MRLPAALFLFLAFAAHVRGSDLLQALTPEQVARIPVRNTAVYQDPATRALTFTFRYVSGDAEVRIPMAEVNWPSDWSGSRAIEYVFHTSSVEPVAIGFSNGRETKFFITEPLAGIRVRGVIPFDAFVQTRTMTPLLPLGYKVWIERLFVFDRVREVVFKVHSPNAPVQFTLYSFTLRNDVAPDEILDKRPLIDAYGQWIPENWPRKAHDEEQLRRLWDEDRIEPARFLQCALGGDSRRALPATGFFRTAQVEGRWVLVDPHGHPFFSTGMDLVDPLAGSFATRVSGREYLFEKLPPAGPAWLSPGRDVSFYAANLVKRLGAGWREEYDARIVARLKSWGFNTIGNWSDARLAAGSGLPYVLPLQGWTTRKMFPFPYDFPDVFSKEFDANVDEAARSQCEPLKDAPNLIGWFIGNEPHWARPFGATQSWPDMLLADPEPSATQGELKRRLAAAPADAHKIKAEFLYDCARKYFETIAAAIRKHDPNHLVLGIRFAEQPGDRWAEMSRVFDAFSINIYTRAYAPDAALVRKYSEISGRPVLIGEFTACAPGRGLQGLFYFTHKVRDQAERGNAYRYYVEQSAASPYIIGTHWFQLVDDLPTGRPGDEERLNYGFLDVLDLPYPELVNAARQTHGRIYDLKFGRVVPFSQKPVEN